MKISYLITCSTEYETLIPLLEFVGTLVKNSSDEVVVLVDKDNKGLSTASLLCEFSTKMSHEMMEKKTCKVMEHSLSNDYGGHKNFGIENCSGDYIFQIDGDEYPPDSLVGENLHSLIESNPGIEAFAVPRINLFEGVNENHARQWGWRLSISKLYNKPIVNAYDPQWRIYKKDYPRISYKRRLHEKIEGYSTFSILPQEEEWALLHRKSIEKQIETNLKYNQCFTDEENRGHKPI